MTGTRKQDPFVFLSDGRPKGMCPQLGTKIFKDREDGGNKTVLAASVPAEEMVKRLSRYGCRRIKVKYNDLAENI